jgi:hypothetical protein
MRSRRKREIEYTGRHPMRADFRAIFKGYQRPGEESELVLELKVLASSWVHNRLPPKSRKLVLLMYTCLQTNM